MQRCRISFVVVLLFFCAATAQTVLSRTPWQYIEGPSTFTPNPDHSLVHGAVGEYAAAEYPISENDSRWATCNSKDSFCQDPDMINITMYSRLPCCWSLLDFSYFQTLIIVPPTVQVTNFTIYFQNMNNGAQIIVYNSMYPNGTNPAYVFWKQSKSDNLVQYLITGRNRVFITHVDDCTGGTEIGNRIIARVYLNGNPIIPQCCADQCSVSYWDTVNLKCAVSPMPDGTPCNDYNPCTTQDSCQGGICSGNPVYCPGQDACASESGMCDPQTGICPLPPPVLKKCYCDYD